MAEKNKNKKPDTTCRKPTCPEHHRLLRPFCLDSNRQNTKNPKQSTIPYRHDHRIKPWTNNINCSLLNNNSCFINSSKLFNNKKVLLHTNQTNLSAFVFNTHNNNNTTSSNKVITNRTIPMSTSSSSSCCSNNNNLIHHNLSNFLNHD